MGLPTDGDSRPLTPRRAQTATTCAIVLGAFLAIAVPLILIGYDRGDKAFDERSYHLPAIENFSRQWRQVNLHDYSSATSPGFHLAIALIHHYFSQDLIVLRLSGSIFTILLLGMCGWLASRQLAIAPAVLATLPLVFSIYVFCAGVWLLPDNAGWLFVLPILILALREPMDWRTYAAVAILLVLGEFTRQTVLFALAPLAMAAYVHPQGARRFGWILLSALPGLAVLGWLVSLWNGLTPPSFQTFEPGNAPPGHSGWMHVGPNLATPVLIFAIVGFSGVFYSGLIWPRLRDVWNDPRTRTWIGLAALIGLLAATIPETYTLRPQRISGLWMVAQHFPNIAGRSTLMIGMSTLGAALLAGWILSIPERREQWIILTAWISFIVMQTSNAMAWQKYSEPFVLMMIILMLSRPGMADPRPRRWALTGLFVLTVIQIALTVNKLQLLH